MLRLILTLCLLGSSAAHADTIYKYVDKDGRVTFTNIPMRGAAPVRLTPSPSPENRGASSTGTAANKPAPASRSSNSGPANIPQIDSNTQRNRDEGRRRILQSELANEQSALAQAHQAFADYRKQTGNTAAQVQRLLDAITDRERNIAALTKELGSASK